MHETKLVNNVPEGRIAWLNYSQFMRLRKLADAVMNDDTNRTGLDELRRFLVDTAKLPLPEGMPGEELRRTAFTMLRRGYTIEELSPAEFGELVVRFTNIERTDRDDMELHAEGSHRSLYTFITRTLGLPCEAGRGPVWHRANDLINAYRARVTQIGENDIERAARIGAEMAATAKAVIETSSADNREAVAALIQVALSGHSAS